MATLNKHEQIDDTYEVLFFIGEGAFGEVYRVRHKYLGPQVLKLLKEEFVEQTDIEALANEARILSSLTHPNVVRVFEANSFQKNGKRLYFITMGFVSGETLAQLLRRKIQLPVPVARSIFTDVLSGLQEAHERQPPIVHRDIKPENILLCYDEEKPRGMLSDFGLAQSVDQLSVCSQIAGTYMYMAPEAFWGACTPRCDVFSAGVVMYRMLTGILPWDYNLRGVSSDPKAISTAIIAARKTPPRLPSTYCAGCDAALDHIVLKALSLSMEQRYRDGRDFLHALTEKRVIDVESGDRTSAESCKGSRFIARKSNRQRAGDGEGFAAIAGMSDLKDILLQDVILPLQDRELYEEYRITVPNGMLLYGPPGCGKTFVAQKLSEELTFHYKEIRPSDLGSTYVHGAQKKIQELFDWARDKAPAILFIDEIDAVLPNRDSTSHHSYSSEVNEFLAQMSDCSKDGVFIIAATNRPASIDPAMLRTGRFDKLIYVGPPDFAARAEMFKLHLKGRPVSPSIDCEELARLTEHYVSSDIKFLVNEAAGIALREKSKIAPVHLKRALNAHPPSISLTQLNSYEQFKDKRSFV